MTSIHSRRHALAYLALVALGLMPATALAQHGQMLGSDRLVRFGLTTDWATHVHLDRTRDRVTSITQHHGMLFAQSERGTLHAIDAETGQTAWHTRVGNRDYPSLAATSDGKHVAVVNGGHLYVLDMATGEPLWEAEVPGAPAAPPAMGHERIYIPLVDGTLITYAKSNETTTSGKPIWEYAWRYAGAGSPDATPLVTNTSVLWTTTRGMVFGSRAKELDILFRFETGGPVLSTPAYLPPLAFVASMDRYVYAIDELSALVKWRFSAGAPIGQSPIVIDDEVYAITDAGGMYALDSELGTQKWWAEDVTRFVSASGSRVYAADAFGRLLVLNAETGNRLAALNTQLLPQKVTNIETDRIYLGTETGVLQCVRETALVEPIRHRQPLVENAPSAEGAAPPATAAPVADDPGAEPPADVGTDPDPFDAPAPATPPPAENPRAANEPDPFE